MRHPLDRPVWNTLTTKLAHLAEGGGRAWRMRPDYGPFVAAADASPDSLASMAVLIPAGGAAWTIEGDEAPPPPGTEVRFRGLYHQMIAEAVVRPDPPFAMVQLGEADAPEMLALATLTVPGPFVRPTHRIGAFYGVKQEGRLVAMAGERMQLDGFTEVSGVCTHPDHRGRGYAGALMREVAHRILARDEAPFLHVNVQNAGAIALYESLGFRIRDSVTGMVLARP